MKRLILLAIAASALLCGQSVTPGGGGSGGGSGGFVYIGNLAGLPATCTVGQVAFVTDATAGQNQYNCTATNVWTQNLNSGTGGANINLSNLTAVSLNSALLAQTGIDLGSTTKPVRNMFLYGAGTYGTTYFELTGTPTSTRTITIPDATDTMALLAATQTFTNKSIAGSEINSGLVISSVGGTGVNNTATLTLGTSNHNWATLGTGLVKNTTTTGALTNGALSDITALFTGTCTNALLLGSGACLTTGNNGVLITSAGGVPSISTTLPSGITLVAPALGTPASGVLTNVTGLPPGAVTSAQGNGPKFQLSTGTTTTNDCVKYDANGNTVDAGSACGSGGAPAWSSITNGSGNLAITTGGTSIFSTTSALNQFFAYKNTTAAVVGTSQGSPIVSTCGRAFHGSADVEDCLTISELPGNGNDAAIAFNIAHAGTSTGTVTTNFPGPVSTGSDGVHPSYATMVGNTTAPTVGSNLFALIGPPAATFTAYGLQFSSTAPAADGVMKVSNVSSGVSTVSYGLATPAEGGSGVANTATHTLGSSNQNWATLGTGIVKNTTTTGAISDAASADVIGLWSGTCSSSTFLRGDGACAAASTSSALSAITAATGTNTIANGNNPQVWNFAQTTNTQTAFAFGDTSAATGTSDILLGVTTAAASTEIPVKITQGTGIATTGNPVASALTVVGGAGGAVAVTAAGNVGGPINLTTGAGSAGGATSGTGGAGGALNLTAGNGGAATAGSTTGAGGSIVLTPGSAGGTGTAGAQGNVQIVGGTVGAATTTSALSVTDTWNTSGVVDALILGNVTNTGSGALSKLFDLQIAGTSQFNVDKSGNTTALGTLAVGSSPPAITAGTAGAVALTEGTEFTNVSGTAGIYPDSTTHEFMAKTNGASSKGMMVRSQPGAIKSTALVASVSTATLCAASAGACNIAGQYHVSVALTQTGTACTANTTNGVSVQLTWTDGNGTAHSAQTLPLQTNASLIALTGTMAWTQTTLGSYGSADFNIDSNGSIIQYATTFAQCTTGSATYALDAAVTRLQ